MTSFELSKPPSSLPLEEGNFAGPQDVEQDQYRKRHHIAGHVLALMLRYFQVR